MSKDWDQKQREAIRRCTDIADRLVPVSGKAGTGKTSIIADVHGVLTQSGYTVGVSAPTGKAAKRIKEATGIDAVTNHRLLGFGFPFEREVTQIDGHVERTVLPSEPSFDAKNRLPFDVLLCDEYAMVTQDMHRKIIAAMKRGSVIRMFGDVNQLKPIEEFHDNAPSAFETMLKKFHGVVLEQQHRAGEGSGIVENAGRILQGNVPSRRPDFSLIMTQLPVKSLQDTIVEKLSQGIDFSSPDHQVITCMNPSWVGVARLNPLLQSMFWKREHDAMELPRWASDKQPVRVQVTSKVVYTANTYDLGNGQYALNGEVGTVVALDHDTGEVTIDLGDRTIVVPPLLVVPSSKGYTEIDPRCNIQLAYALTTHKMQGSEAGHVIYVMNKSVRFGLNRRNFYTGVTRARNNCTVITDQPALQKALRDPG